jgi:hypothetical protein
MKKYNAMVQIGRVFSLLIFAVGLWFVIFGSKAIRDYGQAAEPTMKLQRETIELYQSGASKALVDEHLLRLETVKKAYDRPPSVNHGLWQVVGGFFLILISASIAEGLRKRTKISSG